MTYFKTDHDRENLLDAEQIKSEYEEESSYIQNNLLEKFNSGELDTVTFSKFLQRKRNIDYFLGRLDGEKYAKELIK